ncbi:MAG TPA: hypothetical protein DGT21_04720 [Armatimonadetes bacterium]|jgi:PAS domain S-box-containing protein|nr:hypothetical protein [Armatimonadota bacterium]
MMTTGMNATTRVDLHCHSIHSDGTMTPRELAQLLHAHGVAAAALTDHDTTDGLPEFRDALARHGIGFISGVELTVSYHGEEVHLLAYGIDPADPVLQASMLALRQAHPSHTHSIAGSMRVWGSTRMPNGDPSPVKSSAEGGLDIAQAIELVHQAGGRAFLAHPHMLAGDADGLRDILRELKAHGLDGVEAYYQSYTPQQQQMLAALAAELDLLTSGGTDAHEARDHGIEHAGVDMPTDAWKRFRNAVNQNGSGTSLSGGIAVTPGRRFKWRHFIFHFVFPTAMALALFAVAMFGVFLPAFQRSLLERKREMIRELTNSAWSILAEYERDERAGLLTRADAQSMARGRIEYLRYGREAKDYFWLQDMHPRIIMHPYRQDLNGQDVSAFLDPRGVPIFVQFADLVRRQGEGYIEYYWQWKDDPSRVVPKESYIRGFEPWGWIIGTGIYLDDVRAEISRIQRSLLHTLLGISGVVLLLLLYVMQQSLRLERERSDAERSLCEATDRYRSVVEATTEGTLLVLDGRCRYANPLFLRMVGYSEQDLALLDIGDLLPDVEGNTLALENIRRLQDGEPLEGFEGLLQRRDGVLIECVFALSRVSMGEQQGFLVLAREIGLQPQPAALPLPDARARTLQELTEQVPVGLFRARATARGTITYANGLAIGFLRTAQANSANAPLTLAALFPDTAAWEGFLAELEQTGAAVRRLAVSSDAPSTGIIDLHTVLVRPEDGATPYVDGIMEDVTLHAQQAAEREAELERLQASLLFLHEPVSALQRRAPICELHTPAQALAAMMTSEHATAVLVRAEDGTVIGIITDHDLRERIVATDGDLRAPAYRLMSSPLLTIPEQAAVYQALLTMEERAVQHLAVTDDAGGVIGLVRNQELLQFQSYGAIVLTREIGEAATAEEVVRSCRRVPEVGRALIISGAYPERVTSMLSAVCDAATRRFVELAQEELGPSPVPFSFIALGSHGRQELTLSSDQDNAIVYVTPDGREDPRAAAYLGEVGRRVCGWLDQAGYPYCTGDIMAQNPRWCQPVATWQHYFSEWVRLAEPRQLLEFSIFFDFRTVWGDDEPARQLREHIYDAVQQTPAFMPHFAQNSLLFKPPLRLFGRIVGGVDHARQLNLKDALMPIVNFARLYALSHGLRQTHTLERLSALVDEGVLPAPSRDETAAAYGLLMRLRLRRQSDAQQAGRDPDNTISTRGLRHSEEAQLNQAFAQIEAIQKRISQEFLGG